MKRIALAALLSLSLSSAQAQTATELAKTYLNMQEMQGRITPQLLEIMSSEY